MNNKERYDRIIAEVFELGDTPIDESMERAKTPKWDSLVHLTLVAAIEDEFDIMLDTEDILSLNSYARGLEIVNNYCSEA